MRFGKFYSLSYPHDIAYMLQNVEYDAAEYFRWLRYDLRRGGLENVVDFRFKLTRRSQLVFALAGLLFAGQIALGTALALILPGAWAIAGFALLLIFPFTTAILIGLAIWLVGSITLKRDESRYLANIAGKLKNHDATVIAIVGSYGKSTMRDTLATVLRAGRTVATQPENHNTPAGVSQFVDTLSGKEEVIIVEIGEYVPGDVKALAEVVKPDYAIVTGINEQHMMRMKSKANTIAAIYEITEFVKPDHLYINGESEWAVEGAPDDAHTYTEKGVGDWKVNKVKPDMSGVSFELKKAKAKKVIKAKSPLLGRHQVGPLALTAEVATRIGLGSKQIQKGLAITRQFPRRFELQTWPGGVTIIDDTYNGNKDGFIAAIDFLNGLKASGNGKRIYITPGIIELGHEAESVHKEIGTILAHSKIEKIYLVRNRLTEYVEAAFKKAGGKADLEFIENHQEFIINIDSYANPGDIVMLQNSQHDDYFYS